MIINIPNDGSKNSYKRRKRKHDYYAPFIYHIILKKLKGAPVFSHILGDPDLDPKDKDYVRLDYTKMGYSIFRALKTFENKYPEFEKEQYIIMPDHIHIIFFKKKRTEIHLSEYMEILKGLVSENYKEETGLYLYKEEIFEESYTDKLLYDNIKLKDWIYYIKDNHFRRAMIIKYPDFFTQKRNLNFRGNIYEGYGNIFLLNNPGKFAVRVRKSFSDNDFNNHLQQALEAVDNGDILVSPYISPKENDIRKKAVAKEAKLIWIQFEAFGEKFKPSKEKFELCSHGRLLLISMGLPKGTELSYEIASRMNDLASYISKL